MRVNHFGHVRVNHLSAMLGTASWERRNGNIFAFFSPKFWKCWLLFAVGFWKCLFWLLVICWVSLVPSKKNNRFFCVWSGVLLSHWLSLKMSKHTFVQFWGSENVSFHICLLCVGRTALPAFWGFFKCPRFLAQIELFLGGSCTSTFFFFFILLCCFFIIIIIIFFFLLLLFLFLPFAPALTVLSFAFWRCASCSSCLHIVVNMIVISSYDYYSSLISLVMLYCVPFLPPLVILCIVAFFFSPLSFLLFHLRLCSSSSSYTTVNPTALRSLFHERSWDLLSLLPLFGFPFSFFVIILFVFIVLFLLIIHLLFVKFREEEQYEKKRRRNKIIPITKKGTKRWPKQNQGLIICPACSRTAKNLFRILSIKYTICLSSVLMCFTRGLWNP